MRASNDVSLAMADRLRHLSDRDLAELLSARSVAVAGIRDFFDLADALLASDSIGTALGRLPRPSLIALAVVAELGVVPLKDAAADPRWAGDDAAAAALRLGLLLERDGRVTVPSAVAEQLPPLRDLLGTPAPPALSPVSGDRAAVDRAAAERAFTTTAAVAEVVAELRREPGRELARGGLALPDGRRLAAAAGVRLDDLSPLLELAESAGLIATAADRVATAEGGRWLPRSSAQRWATLADAWLAGVPDDVRGILRDRAAADWGDRLQGYIDWRYPLGGAWIRQRVAATVRSAALLGLTAGDAPSTAGSLLLTAGVDSATEAIGFPTEVDRVYLQHDLSVISPGPLAPAVAARLRGIAEAEGSVTGSYRVTTASLNRALAEGETASSIRAFLSEISLSGIPQPLDYLITEAAARHGLVRVRGEGRGAVVHSADATLLRTIAVDQTLSALSLVAADDRLVSRFDQGVVFWNLAEARYPVAAEDAQGRIVRLERPRRTPSPAAATRPDPMLAFIEKLRLGGPHDAQATDRAWLVRQLEAAIRAKLPLAVTVTMPDGSTVQLQLQPASVAGGRLRARDRRTDLERTLPLSSIVDVDAAE